MWNVPSGRRVEALLPTGKWPDMLLGGTLARAYRASFFRYSLQLAAMPVIGIVIAGETLEPSGLSTPACTAA